MINARTVSHIKLCPSMFTKCFKFFLTVCPPWGRGVISLHTTYHIRQLLLAGYFAYHILYSRRPFTYCIILYTIILNKYIFTDGTVYMHSGIA